MIKLAQVHADLSDVPLAEIKRKRGEDGYDYYSIDFKVEMTCFSATTKYALVCNGKRYNTVTVNYETTARGAN